MDPLCDIWWKKFFSYVFRKASPPLKANVGLWASRYGWFFDFYCFHVFITVESDFDNKNVVLDW